MSSNSDILLNAILQCLPDVVVFSLDTHYQYIAFNAKHKEVMNQIWGKEIELGMNMLDVISNRADRFKAKQCFDRALNKESFILFEEYGDEKIQRLFWEDAWAPLISESGEVVGLTCVVKNITERKVAEDVLEKSEQRFNNLFEQAPLGYQSLDENGFFLDVNEVWLTNLGYLRNEVIGHWFGDFLVSEDIDLFRQQFSEFLTQEKSHVELKMRHKSGSVHIFSFESKVGHKTDGSFDRTHCIMQDITQRKIEEETIRENEERLSVIFEQAAVGMSYGPAYEGYAQINQKYCDIIGYSKDEMKYLSFEQITYPEDLIKDKAYFDQLLAEEIDTFSLEKRYIKKDGSLVWANLTVSLIKRNIDKKPYVLAILEDISERKKSEEEMLYLNFHDHLTGLYNRRFYEEELKRVDTQRNLPITLIMIDMNGLKLINDAFGHEAGDTNLKKIASVLKRVCREGEIIARIGGDEFVILLPKSNGNIAEEIIHRINEALSKETIENVALSISAGFSTKEEGSQTMKDVFRRAEDAMYRQKLTDSSSIMSKTIDIIMRSLYEKNNREMLHSMRVSEICEEIALKIGMAKSEIQKVRVAGLMHDIGKIGVSDNILNKIDKLTPEEMFEVRQHSEVGYRILSSVNEFSELSEFVLAHHERWDSKGYPKGLGGEGIPLQSRIIAIADAFDAMTSDRTYRRKLSFDEAIKDIGDNAGKQFDPQIAQLFIQKVANKFKDR